jgi:hypothetical protein
MPLFQRFASLKLLILKLGWASVVYSVVKNLSPSVSFPDATDAKQRPGKQFMSFLPCLIFTQSKQRRANVIK